MGGVCVLLVAGAAFYATRHLAFFAKWALERAFPGAKVEITALDFIFPSRLDVKSLVLKSRKDDRVLLSLAGGSLAFNFGDLRRRQIGEMRLIEPVIRASPRFGEAFAPTPLPGPNTTSSEVPKKPGAPWSVRRLVCDYGQIIVSDYGASALTVSTKFTCDFHDFSPADAPAATHSFSLWDVTAATGSDPPFLVLDLVEAGFTFDGLLKHRVMAGLSFRGGSLVFGQSLRALLGTPKDSTALPQQSWVLGAIDIHAVTVRLDDDRPEVTDIAFAINTSLKGIPLSQAAAALGAEDQIIEIARLDVLSPFDPLTKVFTIENIYIHFTLGGLLRREIADLTIQSPAVYVGPDLFWYMEDIQKRLGTAGADPPAGAPAGPGWNIQRLFVHQGELVLGSGGRRQYGIPLAFWANAQDVALDNLASLKANTALEIPPQKYVFDSYQLEFATEDGGTLKFSYPPEEQNKNLVGDIKLKDVRWRQYRADNAFVSVTFDKKGINGEFGGRLYRGQAGGGFSFFFDPASHWIGWIYGLKINLRQLTDVVSPHNFQMTGPLDFKLQMDAQAGNIDRVAGDLQASQPGKMVISKLDTFLADIPPTWSLIKQSSTRIALETLRDFDYTKGDGKFWFVQSQGILQLKLQGPRGSRNFDIVLHADDSPDGRWKQKSPQSDR